MTPGSVLRGVRALEVWARARVGRGFSAQGFYARRLRFGDLAFDVGANVGEHTAAMLKRGARVVALEPQVRLAAELRLKFPSAAVLAMGAGDRAGPATMLTSEGNSHLATLNPAWPRAEKGARWDGRESVALTTLDDLVDTYGLPAFVKIDTEGFEDRVLDGLNRAVPQLLFEVHASLEEVAARAFARLAELGRYEYRLAPMGSWIFGPPRTAEDLLGALPPWGDVYARRIDAAPSL